MKTRESFSIINMAEPSANTIIHLNISGVHREISYGVLSRCEYFRSLVSRWADHDAPIHINRLPHVFDHVYGWLIDPEYHYPEEYLSELDFYNIDERPRNITPCLTSLNSQIDAITKRVDYCINVIKNKHSLCKVDLCKNPKYHTADYCLECGKMVFVDREPVIGDIVQSSGRIYIVKSNWVDYLDKQKWCEIDPVETSYGKTSHNVNIAWVKVIKIVLK